MRLPVGVMACKSTLYSAAMREASGLAAAPGLLADWAAGVTGSPAGVSTCALLVVEIGVVCFGNASPGARIVAMTCPTGTSSPSAAVTLARTPSAGASSSTVALSVSTSTTGSPFLTGCPSRFSHCTILPVSCAIPSTGKIISVAMIVLPLISPTAAAGRDHQTYPLPYACPVVGTRFIASPGPRTPQLVEGDCHWQGHSNWTGFRV